MLLFWFQSIKDVLHGAGSDPAIGMDGTHELNGIPSR